MRFFESFRRRNRASGRCKHQWQPVRNAIIERLEDRIVLSAGELDPTFGVEGKVTTDLGDNIESVTDMAVQSDGKVVAVGMSNYALVLARYKSDGTLDGSFGSGGQLSTGLGVQPAGIALQDDGRIVVAGTIYLGGFDTGFWLGRLNIDGSWDASFGTAGIVVSAFGSSSDNAVDVALQSDGRIVVAGTSFNGFPTGEDFTVARYLSDGTLDSTFGTAGRVTTDFVISDDRASGIAIQSDGQIVVVGSTDATSTFIGPRSTDYDFALARYTASGELDTSFGAAGRVITDFGSEYDLAYDVAIQEDGRIIVAGSTRGGDTSNDFALARYTTNGLLDPTFGGTGIVTTDFSPLIRVDAELDPNSATTADVDPDPGSVEGSSDGSIDGTTLTLHPLSVDSQVESTTELTFDAGVGSFGLTGELGEFEADAEIMGLSGTLQDGQFEGSGPEGSASLPSIDLPSDEMDAPTDIALGIAIQRDGKIVVAGYSGEWEASDFAIARYHLDGTLDATFGDDGKVLTDFLADQDQAHAIALQADGQILVAGLATTGVTSEGFVEEDFALARYDGLPIGISIQGASSIEGNAGPSLASVTVTLSVPSDHPVTMHYTTADGTATSADGDYVQTFGTLVFLPGETSKTIAVPVIGDTKVENDESFFIILSQPNEAYLQQTQVQVLIVNDDNPVSVEQDPCSPTDSRATALIVHGTPDVDEIAFSLASDGGIAVTFNGKALGTFHPTARIIAFGDAGDDDISVGGDVALPAWLHGGDGDDRLKGGAGASVLLGEEGNDLLAGGGNRNLMIGGTGADRLVGRSSDDILIAGTTNYDADDIGLCRVMDEWLSSHTYQQRVRNLSEGLGTPGQNQNGAFFLINGATVHDDSDADVLTGGSGQDWFFFDPTLDRQTDVHDEVFATDLDFILGL